MRKWSRKRRQREESGVRPEIDSDVHELELRKENSKK